MKHREIIDVFEYFDIREVKEDMQSIHSEWYDKVFEIERKVKDVVFDVKFQVEGRFYEEVFLLYGLNLMEFNVCINEDEKVVISDGTFNKAQRIIKNKIIGL